jgi:hypothetical protein
MPHNQTVHHGDWSGVDPERVAGVLAGSALLVMAACGPGPLLATIGLSDCDGAENANAAAYFGEISRLDRVSMATLAGTMPDSMRTNDDQLARIPFPSHWQDIAPLHDDGRITSADGILIERGVLTEVAVRQAVASPGRQTFVATEAQRGGARPPVVQFVVMIEEDGDLVFLGECADDRFGEPLRRYRDEVHPGEALEDLFVAIVTQETSWQDFDDWDTGEGAYAAPGQAES